MFVGSTWKFKQVMMTTTLDPKPKHPFMMTTYIYELLSKLLVSPLITPVVVPYIIPYITPFREFRL